MSEIHLTDQQENWIESQLSEGKFENRDAYMQYLIDQDFKRNAQISALNEALEAGEKSGPLRTLNIDSIKKRAKERAGLA